MRRADQITRTLQLLQSFGCPKCSGDCGSANPPVTTCLMLEISKALDLAADYHEFIEFVASRGDSEFAQIANNLIS